ncbi:hypothetical protein VCV18_000514 [Metarhizium anisopliae]
MTLTAVGLRRGDDDRVTGVNTQRIEILHVADSDTVVLRISDNFVLNFLPALHAALNKHLGTCGKSLIAKVEKFSFVVRKSTAKTTQSVSGTNNDGEANILDNPHGFVNVASRGRLGALLADGVHATGKELTVLSSDDGVNRSTQNFDTKTLELILELNTDLQSSLTTKSNVDGVRPFVVNDLSDELGIDRQEKFGVARTGRALRMELDAEVWPVNVHNTLVAAVVGIDKELFPAISQSTSINGKPVVLGGNVTLSGHHAGAGDVVTTITKLHLAGRGSRGTSKQLVA